MLAVMIAARPMNVELTIVSLCVSLLIALVCAKQPSLKRIAVSSVGMGFIAIYYYAPAWVWAWEFATWPW